MPADLPSCCLRVRNATAHSANGMFQKAREKIAKYKDVNATIVAELKKCRADLADCKARAAKVSAANQKMLEKQVEDNNKKCKKLEQQVRQLQQSVLNVAPKALAPGLCSFVFSRSQSTYDLPKSLLSRTSTFQQEWNFLCPTNNLTFGIAGDIAYGEASFGTMARVGHIIKSELALLGAPLQPGDLFLDWGCGAGKWLLFARELLELPEMIVLGIEKNKKIFDLCEANLLRAQRIGKTGVSVINADSESFKNFCPVRIVVNYDGGTQKLQENNRGRIHCHIMRTIFCSPSVDVVVSTRLGCVAFRRYFSCHIARLCGSLWKCIYVKGDFGGSKYNVNVWFRISCMQYIKNILIDPRMLKLISGFVLRSAEDI